MSTPQKQWQTRNRLAGLCSCGRQPELNHTRCKICLARIAAASKQWKLQKQQDGLCKCGRELASKTKCQICLDRGVALAHTNFLAALDAYGGRKCVCCGEEILIFLTIDHINNDGYKTTLSGNALYARLKRDKYPEGYQVLCFNCNLAKARNNDSCPHHNNALWLDPKLTRRKFNKRKQFLDALSYYGNICVCCGENNPFFLTFDHINGDGAAHRKLIGLHIVTWLRHNDFPQDIVQIMCVNCNSGRQRNKGICPHHQ